MDSFWDYVWYTIVVFAFVAYLIVLFQILVDLFRDHTVSGWVKAVWEIVLVLFPYLSAFIYLIVRGQGMSKRALAAQQEAKAEFDQYVRQTAGASGASVGGDDPTAQIERAHGLLEKGAITQDEFDEIKRKALA